MIEDIIVGDGLGSWLLEAEDQVYPLMQVWADEITLECSSGFHKEVLGILCPFGE